MPAGVELKSTVTGEAPDTVGRVPPGAPVPVSAQPVLCCDDHVRVVDCWPDPIVIADGVALKKVITARGVTVTVTACWVGLVPAAPRHCKVYVLLVVRGAGVVQVVAVPLATLRVIVPGTAGLVPVEITPAVAVVSYKVHELASDDVHAIEVVVLNPMVCGLVKEVMAGSGGVRAVVVAVVVMEVVAPPPPPHEARPESASSKTKYAPTKWGVAWVVLRSAMLLPEIMRCWKVM